jgi:hypothetical protein
MIEIAPRDTFALVLAIVAATILTLVLYRRTSPSIPARLRIFLSVLRWLAALIIVLLVADPVARIVRTEYRNPVIAVLVDNSRSMGYPNAEVKTGIVKETLSPDFVRRLEAKAGLRFYVFSDRAYEVTPDQLQSLRPEGSRTDLAEGIRTVVDELSVPPSGFIVFTDGAVNFGEDVANLVSTLRSPVHVVATTQAEPTPDVSLDRIEVTETAYADTDVPVSLTVSARGTGPVDVSVSVRDSTGSLFSQQVSLAGTGAKTRIEATVGAGGIGTHDFSVELGGLDGEAVASNNTGVFSLDVIKGKIRVVLIASKPSWDFAFARRSLDADPNIQTYSFFTASPARRPRIEGAVSSLGEVSGLDVAVVFGEGVYEGAAGELDRMVREGLGLVLLTGEDPASLDLDLNPFAVDIGKGRAGLLVNTSASEAGARHEILRLSHAAGAFSWSDLPPVPVSAAVVRVKPSASVLLAGTGEHAGVPVLAIMRYGQGKVVGFAGYDLWRWDLIPKGFGLDASPFSQILINSIGWLSETDEVDRLSLSTSRRTYLRGEAVDVFARVVDDDLKPVDGVLLEGELWNEATGETSRRFGMTEKGGGSHLGRLDRLPPGKYRAHVTALVDGSPYGEGTTDFIVDTRGLEDFNYDGDPSLLRQLARLTGGNFYEPAQAGRLPDEINPGVVVTETQDEISLPFSLPVFLVLAGLLGIEWWIRKRRMLL